MREIVLVQNKKRINVNFKFLKKDIVFTISLILAVTSCFIQTPKLEYINFHVLISLFNLMVTIKAIEEVRLLDKMAISILNKSNNSRSVSSILILLCFFSSMFVTNDVALLTFVPLTLIISKKTNIPVMETIILQTIAANIGSSFTPMGNPQNIFIYSYFGIEPGSFFTTVLFTTFLGLGLLTLSIYRMKKRELKVDITPLKISDRKQALVWGLVLLLILASIFGMISYKITFVITLMTGLIFNRKLLVKIDYLLLLTFICFFIFVGNISNINAVQTLASTGLSDSSSVYFSSILLSQIISNVPASILIASLTTDWKPLLLGVNIGGLGTIIASLASVISYKLFIVANPGKGKEYLIKFSLYNLTFLAILTIVQYVILKLL